MLRKRRWRVTEVLTGINGYTEEKINYIGERRKDFTKEDTWTEFERMSWYSTCPLEMGIMQEVEARRMKTSGIFHEENSE